MNSLAMTPYDGAHMPRGVSMRQLPTPALLDPERHEDEGLDIRSLIEILRRRWLTVALCTAALVGLSLAYVLITPRLYTAATILLLDPRDPRVLQTEVLPTGSGSDAALVESQVKVITSDAVLARVVAMLGLADVREFGGSDDDPAVRAHNALDIISRRISASRADRTYVLEVKASAQDADLSRRMADAVGEAYLADQTDAARAATRRANEGLTSRLQELQDKLRDADEKVQAYRAAHGLVGTGGTAVTDQQLLQLNEKLIAARASLSAKQSRYETIRNGDIGGTTEALASTVVTALRTQLAEAVRKEAELSATLGDNHPSVIKARAQVAAIRAQIADEIARIAESARKDVEIARADVKALEAELDRLTGRDIKDGAALIELRELQREADSIRDVYASILKRVKETGEQERLEAPAARILAPASMPKGASFPPRMLIVGVAFAVGLGLGIALALMRERFDDRIRNAGQLRRAGLEVLASVPPFDDRKGRAGGFDYAIRLLRAELRDSVARNAERSALFVASRTGDGAPVVALNLALAAVANGERVLIVDADAAHRTLTSMVAPGAMVGLFDVLQGRIRLMDAVVGDPRNGLQCLPMPKRSLAGRGRPSRAAFEKLVAQAKANFDYVIFVGAPLSDEPDARAIAEAVDQIGLVLRANATRRIDIAAALRALRVRGAKTCGVVLTMAGAQA